jgi:galactose mutarotase-like enzyme
MYELENDQLKITIHPKGAELKSIYDKSADLEFMWSGDPDYWAKTSPVLFPIVGALKDNTYQYKGRSYQLPRHGFAREKVFVVTHQGEGALTFSLESDDHTLSVYPFPFIFSISYTLSGNELTVGYRVQNRGADTLYFSVGAHPAFKVPLVPGTDYEDYRLVFEKDETAGRWPISPEGLIEKQPQPMLEDTNILPLTKELFRQDAVVFKHLRSAWVQLASDNVPHGLRFSLRGFPYLGLWAAPGADFLCIEPWCGIADSVDGDGQLINKEGILSLPPNEEFNVAWSAQFY